MTLALYAVPMAHAGHWFIGLLYLAPVAILVGVLTVQGRRDRRAEAQELEEARAPRDASELDI